MTYSSGSASKSYTFTTAGNHSMYVMCTDLAGNATYGNSVTVVVNASDTTPPTTVPYCNGGMCNEYNNANVSFTLSCTDAGGSGCATGYPKYCIDTVNSCTPNTTYLSAITVSSTEYIRFQSVDKSNNTETIKSTHLVIDTTPPVVGTPSPTTATQNQATIFSTSVSDNIEIVSCYLYINGVTTKKMDLSTSPCANCTATTSYIFAEAGTYPVHIRCYDKVNNYTDGADVNITVTANIILPTVTTDIAVASDNQFQDDQVTLRGIISDTGGEAANEIKFWYSNNSGGPYTTLACSSLGVFTTGSFSCNFNLPGIVLNNTNIFYYKAQACNLSAGCSDINSASNVEKAVVIYLRDGGQKSFDTLEEGVTYTLNVAVSPDEGGNVKSPSSEIDCGNGNTACSYSFQEGTSITLTAYSAVGYEFSNWSWTDAGCDDVDGNHCSVTMNEDKDITAIFGNEPPDCFEIIANPTEAIVGQPVIFTGFPDNSDESIAYYEWDFDCDGWDGKTTSNHIGYIFDSPGTYNLRLRVQNNAGIWSETGSCPGGVCALEITVEENIVEPPEVQGTPTLNSNLCVPDGPVGFYFSWIYYSQDGYQESRFDLQISTSTSWSPLEVNSTIPLEPLYLSPHPNEQFVYLTSSGEEERINYGNETHYWRVMVWDELGQNSGWVEGPPFTVPVKPYPNPIFTPNPTNPTLYTRVDFPDSSICYNDDFSSFACNDINKTNIYYYWDFDNGKYCYSDSKPACRTETATTSYDVMGEKTVSLTIKDDVGTCTSTAITTVSVPLPDWEEITPY